ncbi:MAG TPA: sulfite exporter TauE/SafE family protein [Methanocorpusculum sp.]|nr:sulfite exporter TauE/SafE family protein [Methanocorpusculum sp.]
MELVFILFLIAAGLFAGFMAGLLGIGGGFIFAPAMFFVLKSCGVPEETAILVAFGTSLACAFPTILTGAVTHIKQGNVSVKNAVVMGLCGAVLSAFGAVCAGFLPVKVLTILFGCLLIAGAVRLVTKLPSGEKQQMRVLPCVCTGSAAGFFSGLLGVGGGTIIVPLLTIAGRFSMKRAVGTSSLAIVFITFGGIFSYLCTGFASGADLSAWGFCAFGFIELWMWLILVICAVPAAFLSSRYLSGKIPDNALRWMFFVLMILIALQMFGVFELIAGIV